MEKELNIDDNWLTFIHNLESNQIKNGKAAGGNYALNSYDKLCELAVSSYELDQKYRGAGLKDRVQYFLLWWLHNKKYMKYYNSYVRIGQLIGVGHATVIHHISHRKPTANYNANIICIKDFLMEPNE